MIKINGEMVRDLLRRSFRSMGEVAEKLDMTRQNLNYHLRKEVLDENFVELLKTKLGFSIIENDFTINHFKELKNIVNESENEYGLNPIVNNLGKGVPYFDIDFINGFDVVLNNQTSTPTFYINIPVYNHADFWVNAVGKSMSPFISHGDIVALKKVEQWNDFIPFGEIYAIITINDFRTIKKIAKGSSNETFTLVPHNQSPEFSPQEIRKDMITHVFKVLANIHRFF